MTKITDNTNNVVNQLSQKASIFLRLMSDEIVNISTPITPKKSGRLRMDVVKQVLGLKGKVMWGKKYGVYQETKLFKNYTTPGTSYKFAETGARKSIDSTQKIAQRSGLL